MVYLTVQRQVALLVSPGPWREFCANDIQYALYFVMESAFDFSELDMEHLRRWWFMLPRDIRRQKINQKTTGEGRLRRQSQEKGPTGKDGCRRNSCQL
ncbi:hypothetical protein JOQ06_003571 [Pogonophryne albipinna]|uniref:Uncharacterized protein n=1 Tax=Pogonophryne albipinna TaxID=1090488 RepID=A0AAD6AG07_9TELE|nr:hypothetical protein JOQ06_003571 [Pogonophryne albipinna]